MGTTITPSARYGPDETAAPWFPGTYVTSVGAPTPETGNPVSGSTVVRARRLRIRLHLRKCCPVLQHAGPGGTSEARPTG
ncbi:hypothetical protein [Streptomyces sp. NPDC001135]